MIIWRVIFLKTGFKLAHRTVNINPKYVLVKMVKGLISLTVSPLWSGTLSLLLL